SARRMYRHSCESETPQGWRPPWGSGSFAYLRMSRNSPPSSRSRRTSSTLCRTVACVDFMGRHHPIEPCGIEVVDQGVLRGLPAERETLRVPRGPQVGRTGKRPALAVLHVEQKQFAVGPCRGDALAALVQGLQQGGEDGRVVRALEVAGDHGQPLDRAAV